jgi:acetyltransferase-like isoleucine patch superfamily enzyme
LYGPAEATIGCTLYLVDKSANLYDIPMDKPIPNYRCEVRDAFGQSVIIGQDGELYIGGVGVFAGYLGRDDLTEKSLIDINGELFYRTGDLVRMDNNGFLHYRGRKDHQIKLHGQRIELGEIERCLLDTSISDCVVIKWGDDHLIAYVRSSDINEEQLREHCQSHLPPHMIPSIFIVLKQLPLNANGKIDRKRLPSPNFSVVRNTEHTDLIALTPLEEHLRRIFSEAFHNESPDVNLAFGRMGGTSLDVMRALLLIRQEICVKIDISLLFANPSVRQLAQAIEPLLNVTEDISSSSMTMQFEDDHRRLMPSLCIEALGIIVLVCQWVFPIWITYRTVFPFGIFLVPLLHLFSYVGFRRLLFLLEDNKNKVDEIYSWYYYRWWFLNTLWKNNCSFWLNYLFGTPFYNFYLRLCGAQIGQHTHIYTTLIDAPWLLEVGESTFVGEEVVFSTLSYQDQTYKLHKISIGSKCSINARSVLYDNVIIEDNIYIESMSAITGHISTTAHYTSIEDRFTFTWGHIIYQLICLFYLYFIHIILLYSTYCIYNLCSTLWLPSAVSLALSWLIWTLMSCLFLLLLLKFIGSDVKQGKYPVNSYYYLHKVWLRLLIVSSFKYSLSIIPSTPTFISIVLRWLDGYVEDDVEFSELQLILRFPSNLLKIERGVIIRGFVMFCLIEMTYEGQCYVDEICLGSNTELGNHCLIMPGTRLPSKTFVGALTRLTPENNSYDTNVILFGIPSCKMPFVIPENTFVRKDLSSSNSLSFHDFLSSCFSFFTSKCLTIILYSSLPFTVALLVHTIIYCVIYHLAYSQNFSFFEIITRISQLFGPLYTDFFAYIGPYLTGTQCSVFLFRALGARIGQDVILPGIDCFSEPHLVTIGDHVRLNMKAWIQVK